MKSIKLRIQYLCIVVLCALTACETTDGYHTTWSRVTAPNGISVDWRGGGSYVEIQNPMNQKIHVWGVVGLSNYSGDIQYVDSNQPGAFDTYIYPQASATIYCPGEGSTYHVQILREFAN
jgi:hypothetical protein